MPAWNPGASITGAGVFISGTNGAVTNNGSIIVNAGTGASLSNGGVITNAGADFRGYHRSHRPVSTLAAPRR